MRKDLILKRNYYIQNQHRIKEILTERLVEKGMIKTNDAWQLCKDDFGYSTIAHHFKIIMKDMVKTGQANFINNGLWFIYGKKHYKI
jgi:hypothetical protein